MIHGEYAHSLKWRIMAVLVAIISVLAITIAMPGEAAHAVYITGESPIVWYPNWDGSFTSNTGRHLDGGYVFGVDLSEHDYRIDLETAQDAGVEFAILRCAYGKDSEEYDDSLFSYWVDECERLGIPYGVYIYSYAENTVDGAKSEARHLIRTLGGRKPALGIWLDLEEKKQVYALGRDRAAYDELVENFSSVIREELDQDVGIYASLDWLRNQLNNVATSDEHAIWMAQWASKPTDDRNFDYQIWQAGTVAIEGLRKDIDFNVIFDNEWFTEQTSAEGDSTDESQTKDSTVNEEKGNTTQYENDDEHEKESYEDVLTDMLADSYKDKKTNYVPTLESILSGM